MQEQLPYHCFQDYKSHTSLILIFIQCAHANTACMEVREQFMGVRAILSLLELRLLLGGKHLYSLSHLTGSSFFSSLFLILESILNYFPVQRARFSSGQYYLISIPYRLIAGSRLEQTGTRNNCCLSGLLVVL